METVTKTTTMHSLDDSSGDVGAEYTGIEQRELEVAALSRTDQALVEALKRNTLVVAEADGQNTRDNPQAVARCSQAAQRTKQDKLLLEMWTARPH